MKVTDEWWEELQKMPFVSSKWFDVVWLTEFWIIGKNGKTLHLLKASAKKINPNKRRKVIPLLGSISEFHAVNKSESGLN